MMSAMTTTTMTVQKSGVLALPLCIFLALFAVNTETCVRQCIESLVSDVVSTVVAFAERFGRAIETAKGFVEMPEEPAFLTREKESLFSLHSVCALIVHVEAVCA